MARTVGSRQTDEFPAYKHNSSEKAPFSRTGFPNADTSPLSSQTNSRQMFNRHNLSAEEKKVGNELS